MRFLKCGVLVLAVAAVVPLRVTQARAPAGPHPFAPGERLAYSITWSVFDAGEIVATLQPKNTASGDRDEIITTARSKGVVSALYALNDEFRSHLNADTMCSDGISKHVVEGRRRKQTEIVFDGTRSMAVLDEHNLAKPSEPPKHSEEPINGCVQDVISAFYFLRSQPMQVGDRIKLQVNDGSKTTNVTAEVQAREQIDTPFGRRNAFRVEPTVFGSLYKRKGRMLIWFSDDDQRLPLRIKAMISVGTITGTLRSASGLPAIRAVPPQSGALRSTGSAPPPHS